MTLESAFIATVISAFLMLAALAAVSVILQCVRSVSGSFRSRAPKPRP